MNMYSIKQLIENRCMQFDHNVRIGIAVYELSNGKICDGCPKNKSTCETLIALQQEDKAERSNSDEIQKQPCETVREEAARRGVSIKQVRVERRDSKQ